MNAFRSTVTVMIFSGALANSANAQEASDVYANFPIAVKGYTGDAKNSVSYGGQIARQLLHESLKNLSGQGGVNPQLKEKMLAYFSGTDAGREILAPKSKGAFVIAQSMIDEISTQTELASKTYKGAVLGWPGNGTGAEVLAFMIDKASATDKGFDPLTGYDYPQLISKFIMGAVFYNQAVDHYLTKSLVRSVKPNNAAYDEGAPYTGKEHVWDEAFGYFGAPAHALLLSPQQAYSVAKLDDAVFAAADHNRDGKVDLTSEMIFGPAYYAADIDKSGKTSYLKTIIRAFIDGRALISSAKGSALNDAQYGQLNAFAATIKVNWEKVLAEATFKYAGDVYKDLNALQSVVDSNGDAAQAFFTYAHHWGELKGFSMALQTGGKDLGETSVALNRLLGYSPVLLGGNQVSGIDRKGTYQFDKSVTLGEYMVNMLKVQQLLVDKFEVIARHNDSLAGLSELVKKIGNKKAAEAD